MPASFARRSVCLSSQRSQHSASVRPRSTEGGSAYLCTMLRSTASLLPCLASSSAASCSLFPPQQAARHMYAALSTLGVAPAGSGAVPDSHDWPGSSHADDTRTAPPATQDRPSLCGAPQKRVGASYTACDHASHGASCSDACASADEPTRRRHRTRARCLPASQLTKHRRGPKRRFYHIIRQSTVAVCK